MTKFFFNLNVRIFLLSLWMLFLELFLIRWVSTEIRIFAYVNNLVLLACFIGVGLGCYFADRKIYPVATFVLIAILIVMVNAVPFVRITDLLSVSADPVIWYHALTINNIFHVAAGVVLTVFMFGVMAGIFFPIGQLLGAMFIGHRKTIIAYSYNIAGNLAGIWVFAGLSFWSTPPWVWFIVAVVPGIVFLEKHRTFYIVFALSFILSFTLLFVPSEKKSLTLWSPYQKLDVYGYKIAEVKNGFSLMVNNVTYMNIIDISENFINKNYPSDTSLKRLRRFNQYEIPCAIKRNAKDVLIVGAGAGNDVAGALRGGAANIDAVEIDPLIYKLGYILHPEHPYQNPRVRMHIDDARSFMKRSSKKYDIVSFGLLDSHTLSSNYNNIRLDHYVYTLESFQEAARLLKPDGIMTVTFQPQREWISNRINRLLMQTFGVEPIAFRVGEFKDVPRSLFGLGGVMFVTGENPQSIANNIKRDRELESYILTNSIKFTVNNVKPTTDDWPYLYLQGPSIPKMYLYIILSLIIIFYVGARGLLVKAGNMNLHFLFLGAGFLLLEFQNVSKASLLFGSTWTVNAYVISAILILILLANLFSYLITLKDNRIMYLLLIVSVLTLYLVPYGNLNISNYLTKATLIALFMNIPIFFAGVIFINSFSSFPRKDIALGSNLLGASVGGLLESVSFIVGIKMMLLFVLALYVLSFIFREK